MNLEERLQKLDSQFGFVNNPEGFNFELSPERIAYRNEALRTHNRDLYANYLAEHYANEMAKELRKFDEILIHIVSMEKEQLLDYVERHGINLLKSDIDYKDPDAIFKPMKVAEEDIEWHVQGNENDLFRATVTVEQALEGKSMIYIITDF